MKQPKQFKKVFGLAMTCVAVIFALFANICVYAFGAVDNGSITAFLVSQIIDVTVFHKIKKMTGEKWVWLRATGSTVVSQLVDSFIVLFTNVIFFIPMVQKIINSLL